jgi:hypothetical protein
MEDGLEAVQSAVPATAIGEDRFAGRSSLTFWLAPIAAAACAWW